VALPMVVPPSSSSLFSVLKPIFGDNLMCLIITSLELPLVEFGGLSLRTLCLKCVLLIRTRQRSSAWALLVEKHQQN
jgi:hypothetical protein